MKVHYKHPKMIRWNHWINFPLLTLMIWSGLRIYWANEAYIFPKFLYAPLSLPYHLSDGMAVHFFVMWLFALNGILYVGYLLFSGAWRELWPEQKSFRESIDVTLAELGLREFPAQGKFNAAQRIVYTSVIVMGLGSLLTGLAIYKPVQLGWLARGLGGYRAARLEHYVLTMMYVAFFFVHVGQVVRAGWNNLRSMVSGYEITGE